MSIIVSGIRLALGAPDAEAVDEALGRLGLRAALSAGVYRTSIDARHGCAVRVCSVLVNLPEGEAALVERLGRADVRLRAEPSVPVPTGTKKLTGPPVIIGFGPAGMFAARFLARAGYRPLVFERGGAMHERDAALARFHGEGVLDTTSNVQFGEGGAGTYSDGKLTTRINDARCELVLRTLHENGAPDDILVKAKPHIGTDILKEVVVSIRREIERLGGQVRFGTAVDGFLEKDGVLRALRAQGSEIACSAAVLAVGHSARDTVEALFRTGARVEPKAFSVGVRIEHRQEAIDRALYGRAYGHPLLPPAEYTLSYRSGNRACYSFCMCPGGSVVAAASEEGGLVTNGMSCHARDGENANAALAVSVAPDDFPQSGAFGGVAFQRALERAAYRAGGESWRAPAQTVGGFLAGRGNEKPSSVQPTYPFGVEIQPLEDLLPPFVTKMLREGIRAFGGRIRGFDAREAVLTGVETRTSSPVRIVRGEDLMSEGLRGLIPCGEGAGYAGGIMSAAVDGIRAAEKIMAEYAPD